VLLSQPLAGELEDIIEAARRLKAPFRLTASS
jgi:hypothetical protein